MIGFYPQIKGVHVAMVLASVILFAARGAGALAGWKWPMAWPLRWASIAVDTALLTAALMLLSILPWAMFRNGWLAMKLGLLCVYVVLGFFALRPGRSRGARLALYAAALAVYGWMFTIARSHHPLGLLRGLGGP